ncbi:MAG: hypothetical protein JXB07_11895 [Anaerolineae bacterium]|nr:hypothetical protein [Anaerolineae bacterium]
MNPLVLLPFIIASAVLLAAWLHTRRRLEAERIDRARAQKDLGRHAGHETEIALLKALGEAARSPLSLVDANRQIIHLNTAARELFGVTPPIPARETLIAVTRHHEIDQLAAQALSSGEALEAQVTLQGSTYRVMVTPVEERQKMYAAIAFEDVTELQRLGRARRDMVANVSHELRTPITSIRLLVDTLLRGKGGTKRSQELLGKIAIETDTLQQMAQELLDLAMIESGRAELMLVPVELGPVIREVVEQLAAQADHKKLSIREQLPQSLVVLADTAQVKRVLGNLLHNAIKFTPTSGSVTISTRPKDGWAWVTVTDSGPGIAPEERERVFERFYRGDRSRQSSGTGLGLAIAKHIVLAHGGRIWVEEIPTRSGTCICFTLPLAESSSPA